MKFLEVMKRKKYSYFNTFLLIIAFAATVLCVATGSYVKEKENIQAGSIASMRYVSPKDIVDTAATDKLREQARDSVSPLYKHDPDIQSGSAEKIDQFFTELARIKAAVSGGADLAQTLKSAGLKIPVAVSEAQFNLYAGLSPSDANVFKNDLLNTISFVYEQGITDDSMQKSLELAKEKFGQTSWSDGLKNVASFILGGVLEPNLVLDTESMIAAKEQKAAEIQDVVIMKNQKIVDEGEIITDEIYRKLNLLNLLNEDYSQSIVPLLGSIAVVVLLFLALTIFIITRQKRNMMRTNEMLMLFTSYVITIFISRFTAELSIFTLIPLGLFPMLVSMLIDSRIAVIVNSFVCIIAALIYNGDSEFLLYFLISGTLAALLVQFSIKRNLILGVALAIFAVNIATYVAVGLFFENGYSQALLQRGAYGGIVGIISLIICIGSMPIWEAVFEANTSTKLLELSNPNNEIIRRLMVEAPGTYHHSLLVANLSEAAAVDVGANPNLCRVGAYFHDIGKLKYPLYFSENQTTENPHDNLEPHSSAQIIKQHVLAGIEMANENGLPLAVKSIIQEHHGTTLIKVFYYRAAKQYPLEELKESDFSYPGPIPQNKEAAVVMLADTVEAAVRSTISSGKNMQEVGELIRSLIRDKLEAGQLYDSNLKIKDLDTIQKAFVRVFQGMYHQRVAYPKQEELDAIEKEKISHSNQQEQIILPSDKKGEKPQ